MSNPPSQAITNRAPYSHFAPEDRPQSWFYEEWHTRQQQCPVSHSTEHGGFYLATRYEDVFSVLTDPENFTSTGGAAIPPQPFKFIPEDVDPPRHRGLRKIVNASLAPQVVAEHEAWIRSEARRLLDGLKGRTSFDLVRDFAGPLPREIALKLIGIPPQDLTKISAWTEVLTYTPRESEEAQSAGGQLFGYLAELVAARINGPFSDDLVSLIVQGEVDGEAIGQDEMMSYVALLLFGGLHTTTHAIAAFLVQLAQQPEARKALVDNPAKIADVLDEALRFTSPSSHLGRVTTKEVNLGGCPIPAGSRVMASLGAANMDPTRFDDPTKISLDRGAQANAAFGLGPHRCVGSHLAKLQMKVAYEEFLAYFPDYSVPDMSALRYAGAEVRGLITAPIVVG